LAQFVAQQYEELLPSTIVIMSKVAGEAKKQLLAKKVAETLKKGDISKTTEEMFHGIMTQKFETQGSIFSSVFIN
jgi:hypothetical protein